jgi:antitoxin ParD1/3/4
MLADQALRDISSCLPETVKVLMFINVKNEYLRVAMATTSRSLGDHWETFIRNEIASSRYGSASEVVRDALRTLEERKQKLDILKAHLAQGACQADKGQFVENFSMDSLIEELDKDA